MAHPSAHQPYGLHKGHGYGYGHGRSEAKPRFDCLASRKEYLDENPAERFRSVFQLTEEQAAAEQAARIDGAIESWRKKVVVDTPQVLVSLRSRDRVCQQDRLKGMLHEHATKQFYDKSHLGVFN